MMVLRTSFFTRDLQDNSSFATDFNEARPSARTGKEQSCSKPLQYFVMLSHLDSWLSHKHTQRNSSQQGGF